MTPDSGESVQQPSEDFRPQSPWPAGREAGLLREMLEFLLRWGLSSSFENQRCDRISTDQVKWAHIQTCLLSHPIWAVLLDVSTGSPMGTSKSACLTLIFLKGRSWILAQSGQSPRLEALESLFKK